DILRRGGVDMARARQRLDQGPAQDHDVGRLARQQPLAHGADGAEHAVDAAARARLERRTQRFDQTLRRSAAQDADALHCGLMPACWVTLAHFSMSRRRKASNSSGDMVMGTAPCLAHASRIAGLAMILAISAFRRSMISLGVPLGAIRPSQIVVS